MCVPLIPLPGNTIPMTWFRPSPRRLYYPIIIRPQELVATFFREHSPEPTYMGFMELTQNAVEHARGIAP